MGARRFGAAVLAPVRARLRREEPMVPGYLVVGTKRGGSTSIAHWITQHPEVAPCRATKGTHYFDVNFQRGWRWYLSAFEKASGDWRITGEASPYYMFHPLAPQRIAEALPDVRIIVSLREPVARAWSHHQYETQQGFENRPFQEAIDLEQQRLLGEEARMIRNPGYESYAHRHYTYLQRGHYAEQLRHLYRFFAPEQVLVLRSEAVFADPQEQLSRVWDHLGVDQISLSELGRLKATNSVPDIDPELRMRLTEYYRPWNDQLAELLGADFAWNDDTLTTH
jgi:sulfotransferase family protein